MVYADFKEGETVKILLGDTEEVDKCECEEVRFSSKVEKEISSSPAKHNWGLLSNWMEVGPFKFLLLNPLFKICRSFTTQYDLFLCGGT